MNQKKRVDYFINQNRNSIIDYQINLFYENQDLTIILKFVLRSYYNLKNLKLGEKIFI